MTGFRQIHEQLQTLKTLAGLLVEMRWPNGVACTSFAAIRRLIQDNEAQLDVGCKSGKASVNEVTSLVSICQQEERLSVLRYRRDGIREYQLSAASLVRSHLFDLPEPRRGE